MTPEQRNKIKDAWNKTKKTMNDYVVKGRETLDKALDGVDHLLVIEYPPAKPLNAPAEKKQTSKSKGIKRFEL